jgi:2-(1,2-epoxy-1,2-dihydrophenyl)acetyl-CoA isomerase
MAEQPVLFAVDQGVGVVTLNRPDRLNAVNWPMAAALVDLFRDLRFRDDVRTIVLTGAGRGFCAGGDAEWLSGGTDRGIPGLSDKPLERYQKKTPAGPFAELVKTMIFDVEKPIIAAITGPAMGAGLAFALACDRRFADASARMSAAMVRLGFSPDCGVTWLLPRVTNLSTALMMVETGSILDAQQCLKHGLIDELTGDGEALTAAMDYARKLAQGPSVAVDLARRCVYKAANGGTLEEILDYEAIAGTITANTADAAEGTKSFVEKRKPVFKGC